MVLALLAVETTLWKVKSDITYGKATGEDNGFVAVGEVVARRFLEIDLNQSIL